MSRQRLCCDPNCPVGDPCDAEGGYSPCSVDRVAWAVCSGTVYDCEAIDNCPDSGCDEGEEYTVAASAKIYTYFYCGGCRTNTCTVTAGAWTFTYTDDECGSEYTSGADRTYPGNFYGCPIDVGDPVDIFDNCGACWYSTATGLAPPNDYTHGYTTVSKVTTTDFTDDLNWYPAFTISADLNNYLPGGAGGCHPYRVGALSLWKVTAYQAFSSAAIRIRWYFRDCCYQEETLSPVGDSADGGNSLSGFTTCLNSKTDATGLSATPGADKIFTKLVLEELDVEFDITTTGVGLYYARCRKKRQTAGLVVDALNLFVDHSAGSGEECVGWNYDCPHCSSDDEYVVTCYTDWAQVITITDAENWDPCAGGSTYINWQCPNEPDVETHCLGEPCDCRMEDITMTVTK